MNICNRLVKFGRKIPNCFEKSARKPQGGYFFDSPCTLAEYTLSLYSKVSTGKCTETYDVFIVGINIRCTFRFMRSLQPPHPHPYSSKKKLLKFVQISRPTLAEVGWARAHPWLCQWSSVQCSQLLYSCVCTEQENMC